MMDQSITRRGQPCWYRVQGVGNIAINDSFMLEGAIYHLLKKHLRSEPYYAHLLELFHDVRDSFFSFPVVVGHVRMLRRVLQTTFQTEMGQLVDLITAPEDQVDLNKFSLKK